MVLVYEILTDLWWAVSVAAAGLAVWATGHALLTKREVAAAVGWTGVIWLIPYAGAVLYWLFGINRVRRRAGRLRRGARRRRYGQLEDAAGEPGPTLLSFRPDGARNLTALSTLSGRLADYPLADGNLIEPLDGGDAAYAAMLDAIAAARTSICLCSYIMDHDEAGLAFAEALGAAAARGVAVRVLIDALGARYSRHSMAHELRRRDVAVALFLPLGWPWRMPYFNLRNHRKILVVDGRTGFTGGMNIRHGCLAAAPPEHRIQDLHFRLAGPAVEHLVGTFADDWAFATEEDLDTATLLAADPPPVAGPDTPIPVAPVQAAPPPATEAAAACIARGFSDGPDQPEPRIRWLLLGALAEAQTRVRIVTPYFLPDRSLITALTVASLRGVAVDIVLPARGNLRLVEWAAWAQLGDVVASGCRVWLTPEPFDHTKLMTVDGSWTTFGSANWDARSLRLNFELNVEAYDRDLVGRLDALIDGKIFAARQVGLRELRSRNLLRRLRDGICWLASPYL